MRMIGHVEGEMKARTFSDYLLVQGIENLVEPDKDGLWSVWIHAEEELERAKGLLAAYRGNPADSKFESSAKATALKEQKKSEQRAYEKRLKSRRHLFRPLTGYGFGPLTFVLICISVTVALLRFIKFGNDFDAGGLRALYIADYTIVGDMIKWQPGLMEIRHGEIWRLFTPIFLHFGVLHIVFNMLWLRDLGSMVEARQNSWALLLMVLAVAAGSNVGQYLVGGPRFGGMSGVVYGLVGYIWIRGKLDPASGLFLHRSTVGMMILWFLACLIGLIPNVANMAHGVGLGMGMAWGWLSSLQHR